VIRQDDRTRSSPPVRQISFPSYASGNRERVARSRKRTRRSDHIHGNCNRGSYCAANGHRSGVVVNGHRGIAVQRGEKE